MAGTDLSGRKYKAYPEYKKSEVEWLDFLPFSWQIMKVKFLLKDGAEGIKIGPFGSALKLEDMVNKGIRVYGQENVIKKDFTLGKRFISHEKYSGMKVYTAEKGDILVTMMGTSGKCQVVPENADLGIIDSHLLKLRTNKKILPELFRLLVDEAQEVKNQISKQGKGSIMHGLNSTIVKELEFPLPCLEEQEKIVTFLDHETAKIDTLIAKQEKLIELLKEKRQAVISHAVTKGLNPNAPMRDSGVEWLGEVPEHWEVKKIKYIVKEPLLYGANEAAEDIDKSQPRFVRITDVDEDGTLRDDTFRSLPQEIALPYMLKDGDILLARSGGTVGKSFIYRNSWGSCCFAGYLIKASINEGIIDADWVYFNTLTNFYWDWIKSSQIQATIQNVSADKYNNFEIAIPSKDESREIIDFLFKSLKRFDDLTLKSESAIKLMQERKTALISAAVTGKIDVRDFVSEQGQPQGV